MPNRALRPIAILALTLGLWGCDGEEPRPVDDAGGDRMDGGGVDATSPTDVGPDGDAGIMARGPIGPLGGVLRSEDGRLRLEVPPGALSEEVVLSIAPATDVTGTAIGEVYELGPDGTTFARAVRLTFDLDGVDRGGFGFGQLHVGVYDASGWTLLPESTRSEADRTVTGRTTHFSVYGVIPAGLSHSACPIGQACDVDTRTCRPCSQWASCGTSSECTPDGNPDCVSDSCVCDSFGNGCRGRCTSCGEADVCGNLVDDDCDGPIDEGATEVCNWVDDDCDEDVDEGCATCSQHMDCPPGHTCSGGTCLLCDVAGMLGDPCERDADCTPENTDLVCNAAAGRPCRCSPVGNACGGICTLCEATERCGDGIDNDCNGLVDEGETEVCNRIDDDCDGQVDEGCAACTGHADCPIGQGCFHGTCMLCDELPAAGEPCSTTMQCTREYTDLVCDPTGGRPCTCSPRGNGCGGACVLCQAADVCGDGLDNDCDGLVDEGETEVCNGIDDDCDGQVDEGCAACTGHADCPIGQGCFHGTCTLCDELPLVGEPCSTTMQCTREYTDLVCDPTGGRPCTCSPRGNGCGGACVLCQAADVCGDGLDNDCDGIVDEGETETCNGRDDDCDTLTDEDCPSCLAPL